MKADFEPSQRAEYEYQQALQGIVEDFLAKLQLFGLTSPDEVLEALKDYWVSDPLKELIDHAIRRMVTGLAVENARSWREAARISMKGRMIYNSLAKEMQGPVGAKIQELVNENARLISTFPQDIQSKAATFIKEETMKGRRAAAIAGDLMEQFPDVSRARLSLIARTETSKASTALTQARADELGLDFYVWRTSKDARVRKSHRLMDGVIVAWKEPPSPEALAGIKSTLGFYNGGNAPNCRCFCEPLLDLNQVVWPHRIYRGGQIQYMTRIAFSRLAGSHVARAA